MSQFTFDPDEDAADEDDSDDIGDNNWVALPPVRGALLDCGHESMLPAEMISTADAWCPTCGMWRASGVVL